MNVSNILIQRELQIVEIFSCIVILRQFSYAIKKQIILPKAPTNIPIGHWGAWLFMAWQGWLASVYRNVLILDI